MIKKASRWTAAHCAAVALTAITQMTTPSAAQPQTAGDPAQIEQGRVTYAQKCSHCHGPNMVNPGTITPDLRTFPDDRARFITTVKLGKNGKMPPWGDLLSDDQIADLWAYATSRRNP